MRKLLATITLLVLFSVANAQQTLRELMSAENGTSKHFTDLSIEQQLPFNPRQARAALSLDPSSDLVLLSAETEPAGNMHYRFYQTYQQLPIENSMLIAHVQNGRLTAISGEIITAFDNSIKGTNSAAIPAKRAIKAAIDFVNAKEYAWQNPDMEKAFKQQKADANATYYPSAKLVWFSDADGIDPTALRIAYKVDVYASEPLSRAYYFVDAQTGKVLGKKDELFFTDAVGTAATAYSGSQTIHSDLNGGTYRLRDITKGAGILTFHGESGSRGTDYTSASANWNLAGVNQAALDAHYGVSQTYAFYLATFNRNSYDNQGTALTSYVNDPRYTNNAFWDGSAMNFCPRSNSATSPGGVTAIDVTGHELTHGVTQETSALNYSKEPGAMNESMSDIMGKSVQFWSKPADVSWVLSNDMNLIFRDMSNPNAYNQPDTYKGTFWATSANDNYGVHTNSGVGNFMFYLLVTGGNGTNDIGNAYTVTGIGLAKADKILYRTNTVYLTPTSQYADWRQASINAANDLYPGDSAVLASVQNAWYAVGIGTYAGDRSCPKPAGLFATGIVNKKATLTWTATNAAAYNLKWKASTAAVWKHVRNINGTTYNLSGLTASTAYIFQVQGICGDSTSPFSSSATFTTSATSDSVVYCASSAFSTLLAYTDEVDLGTIKNISGDDSGYGDYTNLTAALTAGVVNKIKLTPGFSLTPGKVYWAVFIDYNQDGDFSDAGEKVATANSSATTIKAFTVPASAKTGSTRLRVQMDALTPPGTDPCATIIFGEVEDYTVNISAPKSISSFDLVAEKPKANVTVSPNPVSGSNATVSYAVANTGKVTLLVLDMFGRVLQTVSQGDKTPGTYSYILNNPAKISSGNFIIAVLQNNQLVAKTAFIAGK